MIDTHLHLDLLDADGSADALLADAVRRGVTDVIGIGVDPLVSSRPRSTLGAPVRTHETVGIHPQTLTDDAALERALAALAELLRTRPRAFVGVGEAGLDARAGMPPQALQRRAFKAQLALAREHGLPIVIHGVRRDADVLGVLDEVYSARAPIVGVWHGFSSSSDTMKQAVARGLMIAVGFMVLNPKARRVREAVPHIPIERLVVETDAPPLAPARLADIVDEVARLRGATAQEIEAATTANARSLFRLGVIPRRRRGCRARRAC